MEQDLIIGDIDFNKRLDDAKMFLHFRINSIWFNNALNEHIMLTARRRWALRYGGVIKRDKFIIIDTTA